MEPGRAASALNLFSTTLKLFRLAIASGVGKKIQSGSAKPQSASANIHNGPAEIHGAAA
jgi:hypothetical protein